MRCKRSKIIDSSFDSYRLDMNLGSGVWKLNQATEISDSIRVEKTQRIDIKADINNNSFTLFIHLEKGQVETLKFESTQNLTQQIINICKNEENRWSKVAKSTLICSRRINFEIADYDQEAIEQIKILQDYYKQGEL